MKMSQKAAFVIRGAFNWARNYSQDPRKQQPMKGFINYTDGRRATVAFLCIYVPLPSIVIVLVSLCIGG